MTVAKLIENSAEEEAQPDLGDKRLLELCARLFEALSQKSWARAEALIEDIASRLPLVYLHLIPAMMPAKLIFIAINKGLLLSSQLVYFLPFKKQMNQLVVIQDGANTRLDLAAHIISHTPIEVLSQVSVNIAEQKYLRLFVENGSYFSILKKGIDKLLQDNPKNKNNILARLFNTAIDRQNYDIASFLIQLFPISKYKVNHYSYQKFLDYQSVSAPGLKSPAHISIGRYLPRVLIDLTMAYADLYPDSPVIKGSPKFSGEAVFNKLTSNQSEPGFYNLLYRLWIHLGSKNKKRAMKLLSKEVQDILRKHPSLDSLDEMGMTKVIKELLKKDGVLDLAIKEMKRAYDLYEKSPKLHLFDRCLPRRAIFASLSKLSRKTLCNYSLILESDQMVTQILKRDKMAFLARLKQYMAELGDDRVCNFGGANLVEMCVPEPVENVPPSLSWSFRGAGSAFFSASPEGGNPAAKRSSEGFEIPKEKRPKIAPDPLGSQPHSNVFFRESIVSPTLAPIVQEQEVVGFLENTAKLIEDAEQAFSLYLDSI